MPFKFVHTADIHLDSPLKSLAMRNPDLADLIGNATRQALVRIVDLCLDENVDALLISGDLYDGHQSSMKTARFLAEQLRRLHESNVLVYIIRGNHDAQSRVTRELSLPDSVKVFGGRGESVSLERPPGQIPVSIHGLSMREPKAPRSLLPKYPGALDGVLNIALMHTSLGGAEGHDLYAPCKLPDLQNSGHQYWALGHIHKRSIYRQGDSVVVMPGMPQGRDVGESGSKSVTLVECLDDGQIQLQERVTSVAQFEVLEVDTSAASDWQQVIDAITKALEQARDNAVSEHLVARVRLRGESALAWRLRRDADRLLTEIEHRASRLDSIWLEKIDIDCQLASVPGGASAGPVQELRHIIESTVLSSIEFNEQAQSLASELSRQLPADLRDILGDSEQANNDALAALSRQGVQEILARLSASGKED